MAGIAAGEFDTDDAASVVWQLLGAPAWMYETPDMIGQHELLSEAAGHFEAGRLVTTLTKEIRGLDAAGLRAAHEFVASGRSIGKVVVTR